MIELDDLRAPPARPEFHKELQRRIEAGERLARGRRRAAALVAVVAGVGIASAASVAAFREQVRTTPIDRTVTCTVPDTGGVNRVDLIARVRGPGSNYGGVVLPNYAEALFGTADIGPNMADLVAVRDLRNGYGSDDQLCRPAKAIALTRSALPSIGVVRGTRGATIQRECWLGPIVTIRAHVTFTRSGKPAAAQLALRSGKQLKPAAYLDWTPTRVAAFASSACHRD